MLFLGQGDAQYLRAMIARECQRHAAPAAADVEHAHARLEAELGGDMRLLLRLRLFQRVVGRAEIGAGILPVGIKEQIVERAGQVVVMRDIGAGALGRVELA